MNVKALSRWKAFFIHLSISLVILAVLLCLIFFVWYPQPFFPIGGWQGIKIITAVDLILGPLLTLLVFNPMKKSITELRRDLSVIAIMQASCLITGVYLVHQQRPVAQVLTADSLAVMSAGRFSKNNIDSDFLKTLPGPSPKALFLELPNDHADIAAIAFATGYIEQIPLELRTDLYRPLADIDQATLDFRLKKTNEGSNCRWVKLLSTHVNGQACISKQAGAIELKTN